MAKHTSETSISISHADQTAELLCVALRDCTLSIATNHTERLLNFGDGRAFIRQTACGLHLRVEAQDLLTFFGIRSLVQVSLSQVATHLSGQLEWHSAGDEPFGALGRRAGTSRC
jgi:hypothetical protein